MSDSDLKPVDITGPTLEEAIDRGLKQLGLARNEVIIEIIEEGSKGLLGMGARDAVVRLIPLRSPRPPAAPPSLDKAQIPSKPQPAPSPKPTRPAPQAPPAAPPAHMSQQSQLADAISADDRAPADPTSEAEAQVARETLQELLEQMNIRASIQMHRSKPAPGEAEEDLPWVLDISGRDLGVLIGRRGETLNALQYVARLIASRELQKRANFVVDVEGYKSRRENTLRSLARRMAARAREQGRTVTLEPMPPNERRIIHLTLRGDNTVTTESVGTGENRKVTIIPVYEGDR